jgi:hypothetical protein
MWLDATAPKARDLLYHSPLDLYLVGKISRRRIHDIAINRWSTMVMALVILILVPSSLWRQTPCSHSSAGNDDALDQQ